MNDLIKNLLEAGVHFGHQTRRWNPKMKRFIFGERGGIHIIDLEKSVDYLNQARDFLKDVATKGGKILFIGTKKQAQEAMLNEAERAEMYYINYRWMGGLLTNFETVKKSIAKLDRIEKMTDDGVFARLTKKEISVLVKQKDKLLRDIGGIRKLKELPSAIFIVDTKKEHIAVKEANKLGIPIVGLVDSNCDPDVIQYPIPGNDDAVKAIRFISSYLNEGVLEGKKSFANSSSTKEEAPAEAAAPEAAVAEEKTE